MSSSDWPRVRLGDLGRIVTGKTPSTKIAENFGGDTPFVTPSDMDGRRVITSTERYLTQYGVQSVRSSLIHAGSVMVSCIGSDMGKAAIAGRDCVTNQQINSIVVDPACCSEYVYYNLSARKAELQVLAAGGSAQPILNKGHFSQVTMLLPPADEQRRIAGILGVLDEKIELNRRMNRTLESIARAIFESWFVDFDPVRKKMEGGEVGLPPDLSARWPAEFTPSRMGPIPAGWRVRTLGDVAHVVDCLHDKKPSRKEAGRPLLQLSNVRDDGLLGLDDVYLIEPEDYAHWTSRFEATGGDCVITNVGRVGAVAQVPQGVRAALGRNMTGIRCKPGVQYPTWLIQALLSNAMKEEIVKKTDTGTILEALNVRSIPRLGLVLPPTELLAAYEAVARPMRLQMEVRLRESATLANVRSGLMPRLMSGRALS